MSGDAAVIYSASAAVAAAAQVCDSRMNEQLSHMLAYLHIQVYFRLQAEQTGVSLFIYYVERRGLTAECFFISV